MDFMIGGGAAMCACIFTNPLEVVKTRMQLQGELKSYGKYSIHYRNIPHGLWTIARHDGVSALQKGLVPALWFQLFLNGFRLGTYQIAANRGLIHNSKGETVLWSSLLFGALGGTLGAASGSPFYLIKTQMQASAANEIAVGFQHKHNGTFESLRRIYVEAGIRGVYRGVVSSIPRAAVGSASQLASFNMAKEYLCTFEALRNSPILTSFLSANIGGVVMTLLMTPFDVVATRLYNQGVDPTGKGILYKGVLDCFVKIMKTEGIFGYYKGLGPSYLRLGPHTVLVLVFWDIFKDVQKLFDNNMNTK